MLRRKPSTIEVKLEDKEELQQLQTRYTTPSSTSNTATTTNSSTTLLQHFDRSSSKPQLTKEGKVTMEVEVKLRLSNATEHQSLSCVLSPFLHQTHYQHNVFFDGAASELSSCRAVLRLRFYGEDPQTAERCVVSLKAKAVLENGVSRVEEDEEDLDPFLGPEIWANPNLIRCTESRILKRVSEEFDVKEDSGYVCLGGFKNVRGVYEWKGLQLELDETLYDFGTLFEIECESSEPEKAQEMIEELLKDNGIGYSCSKLSKFAIFRSGELPS